jgi:hypothetical protein
VLQGCPDLEKVVQQDLPLQALTRCLSFILYMCVISLEKVALIVILDEHDACTCSFMCLYECLKCMCLYECLRCMFTKMI